MLGAGNSPQVNTAKKEEELGAEPTKSGFEESTPNYCTINQDRMVLQERR